MHPDQAKGYLFLGLYDEALDYVDKGLGIELFPERAYLRALILDYLGRQDEALATINDLIQDQPSYNGDRYYFRALIYDDMGKIHEVHADLDAGARNTWGRESLAAYVRRRIEADRGDKAAAIRDLKRPT